MRYEEFQYSMRRIVSTFGQTHYSDERTDMIWKFTNSLDVKDFKEIVDSCISNFKYAPLPNDFLKAFYEIRKRQYKENNFKETFPSDFDPIGSILCMDCYETGYCFVEVSGFNSSEPLLMECHCSFGDRKIELPKWTQKNANSIKIKQFPVELFVPKRINKNNINEIGMSNYTIKGSEGIVFWWKGTLKNSKRIWQGI